MEEKPFLQLVKEWWMELRVEGWAGYKLAAKLKYLKQKIKQWSKDSFSDAGVMKTKIPEEIQLQDIKEEQGQLSFEDKFKRSKLKVDFVQKVKEEIKWRQIQMFVIKRRAIKPHIFTCHGFF